MTTDKPVTKLLSCLFAALFISGCTSSAGVIPNQDGNLTINITGDSGFITPGSLQKEAYAEARNHCNKKGKQIQEVDYKSDSGFGKFPKVSLIFNCV